MYYRSEVHICRERMNTCCMFDSVAFFSFGLETKGGCSDRHKNKDKFHYKDRTVKLISPKSTCDNCLFMCFAYFLERKKVIR
jgi:hypothetical protein